MNGFVDGVEQWLDRGGVPRGMVAEVVYPGADHKRARMALARLKDRARVEVHPYLPLYELAALCRSAAANAYIRSSFGFHHKLLELLSTERPVLAYPGESAESRTLAARTRGVLYSCEIPDEICDALDDCCRRSHGSSSPRVSSGEFSWSAQAAMLEATLDAAAKRVRR